MKPECIDKIFQETAYIRTGGSPEELQAAQYLQAQCAAFGCDAKLESFDVDMANIKHAVLTIDGTEITCKGYLCAGSSTVGHGSSLERAGCIGWHVRQNFAGGRACGRTH